MDEINQVMAMVDAAVGTASSYHESLADMTSKLGNTKDRDGLRAIIESLVQTANEMQQQQQHARGAAQSIAAGNQPAAAKPRNRPHTRA